MTVSFGRGATRVVGLEAVDVDFDSRRSVALWGRSGSGKTTLLHVLGGLVTPTRGSVEGRAAPPPSPDRPRARGAVAYVFQSPTLLPYFTAFENVAFAAHLAAAREDGSPSAQRLLQLVGLSARLEAFPGELSGGEAQRVGIARALAPRPKLLLCDEPTGHLDSDTGSRVLDLIDALRRELDFALIVATHDTNVAARYDRVVRLSDGRIVADELAA